MARSQTLVRYDPEEHETAALDDLLPDLGRCRVLEVGCGDGRMTWRYARRAGAVVAIEPDRERLERARAACPPALASRVEFRAIGIEGLDAPASSFDVAMLSWSL